MTSVDQERDTRQPAGNEGPFFRDIFESNEWKNFNWETTSSESRARLAAFRKHCSEKNPTAHGNLHEMPGGRILYKRPMRELSRNFPRGLKFSKEQKSLFRRDIRRHVGRMFAFDPLAGISGTELSCLKRFMLWKSGSIQRHIWSQLGGVVAGNATLTQKCGDCPDSLVGVREALNDVSVFTRCRFADSSITAPLGSYGSRGVTDYGFDVLAEVREQQSAGKKPVKVLDVGCCEAQMLFGLKQYFGPLVETHGLSPFDEIHFPVDHHYALCAEHLPESFRGAFDLIVSNRALEYSLLPHLALRGLAMSLSPGGRALVQYRTERALYYFDNVEELKDPLRRLFSGDNYRWDSENLLQPLCQQAGADDSLSQRVKNNVHEGLAEIERQEIENSEKEWKKLVLQIFASRDFLWMRELQLLASDPSLTVVAKNLEHYVYLNERKGGASFGPPNYVYISRRK